MSKSNTEQTPQASDGWAICSDDRGIMVFTVSMTRRESIYRMTETYSGVRCMKEWRKLKRDYGFRASHVQVQEYLFKTN